MPLLPYIVTLTTDFGGDGPYVAAMKGVILRDAPGVQLVDVSHVVSPRAIREGAFVLSTAWPWFPAGTVHPAAIDPRSAPNDASRWFAGWQNEPNGVGRSDLVIDRG